MEPEIQEQEESLVEQKSSLHKVTPLSKYLAMTLFIILPFLGGWIGYMFAPEKVVEVERIIEVEKVMETAETKEAQPVVVSIVPLLQYQPIELAGEILGGELNNPNVFSFDDEFFYINGEPKYSVEQGTFEQFLANYGLFKGWIRLDNLVFGLTPVELGTWQLSPLTGVDVTSFEVIGSDYAKDNENIYYQTSVLQGADVDNFVLVGGDILEKYLIGVSNNNVFYKGELLEGIGGQTLTLESITDGTTEGFYIRDGDVIYYNRPVCTFEQLERGELSELNSYNPVCSRAR